MNAELVALNKNRKIFQIAFVTHDLERSMKAWVETLGVGPWRVVAFTEANVKNFVVNGVAVDEPFKFLIAISYMGDIELEIIQPVYGPSIYSEFLEEKGEGLHHIKERIGDEAIDGVLSEYRAKGIGVQQSGRFFTDFHHYLETEPELQFIYELGNCPRLDLPPEIVSTYPAEPTPAGSAHDTSHRRSTAAPRSRPCVSNS